MVKILHINEVNPNRLFDNKKKIVLCHGVFDVLHYGHLLHFKEAKKNNFKLIVSLTPDEYVNKGPDRPYFTQELRAKMIASLEEVDLVILNDTPTAIKVINKLKPNFYAKGSDYKISNLDVTGNMKKELIALKKNKGELIITNEDTYSSSNIINNFFNDNSSQKDFLKTSHLNKKDIFKSLEKLKDIKVCLMGEVILDEYNYVKVLAKSPKENVLSTINQNSEIFFGGILATANNISNFVKEVTLICMVGENYKELDLKSKLNKNIKLIPIMKKGFETIKKKRFIQKSNLHKFFQIQYMSDKQIDDKNKIKIKKILKQQEKNNDLLVINDFGHDFIDKELSNYISDLKIYKSINVQTNSSNYGYNLVSKYSNANYISIDLPEAQLAVGIKSNECLLLAKEKKKKIRYDTISITKGHQGSSIISKNKIINIPAMVNSTIDTMGAGDAYFSITSILSYLKINPLVIGFIGNCSGGITSNIVGHAHYVDLNYLKRFIETRLK